MRRIKKASCLILVLLMMFMMMVAATACDGSGDEGGQSDSEASQTEQDAQETSEQPDENLTESGKKPNDDSGVSGVFNDGSDNSPDGASGSESEAESTASGSQTAQNPADDADDSQTMTIGGSGVEKAVSLNLNDLKSMKDAYFEDDYFALNSYGTKDYFAFRGVKLAAVLGKAGLKSTAKTITFVAADGYEQQLTVEQALKTDYIDEQNPDKKYPVIIAWHENGEDYDPSEGLPFRLVVGQKAPGDINKPQWVSNIQQVIVE